MRTNSNSRPVEDRGFSLVEILVVIVVLGVLATIVVFSVRSVTDRGESSACGEDRRIAQTAVQTYFAQFGGQVIPVNDPTVPGMIGLTPELTLVETGLLATSSELHDISADGEVTAAASSSC